jgi:uncharacterized membrane protein
VSKTKHLFFLASNTMQLRTLALQKQHDGVWTASLTLVCVSILLQIGLAIILFIIFNGDIRNPQQQTKLELYNIVALVFIIVVSITNIVINILMFTTNPKSFLDARSLELLERPS